MKTRDLITALLEADPSGEMECSIYNATKIFVSRLPAYYDGNLQQVECGGRGKGKFVRNGTKINLTAMNIWDLLVDWDKADIDTSELNEPFKSEIEDKVGRYRRGEYED